MSCFLTKFNFKNLINSSLFLVLILNLFGFSGFLKVHAIKYDELPKPTSYVTDQAGVLDPISKVDLEAKLKSIVDTRDAEGAVVIVKDMSGYDISDYANKLFRAWGIGEKDKNNGFLVLISVDDKKSRIEVGRGLEGAIVDGQAGEILREARPFFAKSDYAGGVSQILTNIDGLIAKDPAFMERLTPKTVGQNSSRGSDWISMLLLLAFVILPVLGSSMASTKSWWAGGVLGVLSGVGIGFLTSLTLGIASALFLGALGLFIDYKLSKNYKEYSKKNAQGDGFDSAWFIFPGINGGGFGGGGNGDFGGFGGGDSGGGGASDSF